ncbi:MAG: alanine dehydrogenase [Alphaproteobacteria bacterium]|nr:alanine dehydrogenase [Alphaproteobacteria bacterium]MDA7987911.1 alanine dehydrogenase [Alphaproteobacteria bacterium]MDA7987918.1 alanine dehydrogenase [Alphaproteobacteria bacterium]MDA8000260.1 alanine dehydrogenase [Alphaproteobacteria bacterium]MDA8006552.1 alanine dehydrogenase [Alphaproteobacteria bacterium]
MHIGIPKEVKNNESRVGMTPSGVRELRARRHEVFVERDAGHAIGYEDADYRSAGAKIVPLADDVFARADMIVKVKEPQPAERRKLRRGQILFTYLHLAPDAKQTRSLVRSGATAIAYETVTDAAGHLPLLAPMSEVAGRMSVQVAATCQHIFRGGSGVLLGGVPGVSPGRVCIIGGGVSGAQAARMAVGLGAQVTVLDRNINRLRELDDIFTGRIRTRYATTEAIEEEALRSNVVIGAVLVPGASAPKLLRRSHLKQMIRGSVLVDIAIDQGGCFETSRPTTHEDPTFVVDGVVHYCVANMPGAVARTSTQALTNATLPYVLSLADGGVEALLGDENLCNGLNVADGHITHRAVSEAHDLPYVEPHIALSSR